MYFKMLKHDLFRKKGLNVILFLFITIASVLVFVGSVQIFANMTREHTARELCRSSDLMLISLPGDMDDTELYQKLDALLAAEDNVQDWSTEYRIGISGSMMDYPDYDEEENPVLPYQSHHLCAQPREHDLVYDLNDKPFYVPNGCIAVPQSVCAETGVSIGDTIRYTTKRGNVYELTVSTIFKDNAFPFMVRYIVSDADFEVLSADNPRDARICCIRLRDNAFENADSLYARLCEELPLYILADSSYVSDEYVMMEIISVFVVLICIFLILIILMTIRFTMIAELREEEKEIGMMKALGADTFRFRWLFAAKYTAFALAGGAVGIAAGIPLSGMVVSMFGPDAILPQRWEMFLLGIGCVLFIIAVMIGFSMLVMRRINKISVIDALHGENRGERFSGSTYLLLHKRTKMSVPAYLALSDILGRLKRYLFLIVAYTLGAAILLLPFNARHTVINPSYSRIWLYHSYDFEFVPRTSEVMDSIEQEMEHTGKDLSEVVNSRIEAAGIPAYIDMAQYSYASVQLNDVMKEFCIYWDQGFAEKMTYHKGGHAPTQPGEAAMSSFTAKKYGYAPGSKLTITVEELNEERTAPEEKERTFTITALYDEMEDGTPSIILWDGYEDGYVIDAPEKEKPAVIGQLKELFGERLILEPQAAMERQLRDFDQLFLTLEITVTAVVLFLLALITYLYENIFISEEKPEIALLKSLGFQDGTIRLWHLLRIGFVALTGIVLGEALFWTAGTPLFLAFMQQYEVTGLRFLFEFPVSFLLIPAAAAAVVLVVTRLTLTGIRNIDIQNISEE